MSEKPGWKTTEFYLSLAAIVVGALVASGAFPADSPWFKLLGIAASILAALGYTGARMIVKKDAAKKAAILGTAEAVGEKPPENP